MKANPKDTPAMVKREVDFMKRNNAPKDMIAHEVAEAKAVNAAAKPKKYAAGGMVRRGYGCARGA